MNNTDTDSSCACPRTLLLLRAVFMASCVFVVCRLYWAGRSSINPDAISYMEQAKALVEGRWSDAVSGYWAPGLPCVIAVFHLLGASLRDSAHLAQFVALIAYGLATWMFTTRMTRIRGPLRQGVVLLIVLHASCQSAFLVTPDLLSASMFLFAVPSMAQPRRQMKFTPGVVAGFLGGLAYVVKYFYLPFFIAYWTTMCAARFWVARHAHLRRRALQLWLIGLIAFAVTVSGWVAVLAKTYGRITFSIHIPINLYAGGPVKEEKPVGESLQLPAPGKLTILQTPERFRFTPWEPWKSPGKMLLHLRLSVDRFQIAIREMSRLDLLLLTPGILVVGAFLCNRALGLRRQWLCAHCLITFAIMAAGYAAISLTAFDFTRYIGLLLYPMVVTALCTVFQEWNRRPVQHPILKLMKLPGNDGWVLAGMLVLFGLPLVPSLWIEIPRRENTSAAAAERLVEMGISGPTASSAGRFYDGLYCSWEARLPFLGQLDERSSWMENAAVLQRLGCRTLLLSRDDRAIAEIKAAGDWVHRGEISVGNNPLEVYERIKERSSEAP